MSSTLDSIDVVVRRAARAARRSVGQPLSRVDGPLKVSGTARFAAEVPQQNLLYGALVYSRVARGRIAELDTAEAEAAPGVALVMTHRNAPRMAPPPMMMADPTGAAASNLPVMQDETIHWNGQPVAVVLASTQEQADWAAARVHVRYAAEDARLSFAAVRDQAHEPETVLGQPARVAVGDAEAALAAAPVKVDQVYRTPRHNHAAIELHAVTAAWDGDTLDLHDATQAVHLTQATLAKVFGLPPENVRVRSPFVGGGFGNKMVWDHHLLAAAAARLAGRPVRLVLSREGVFRATGGRTLTEQRVALGANADGRLAALIHTGVAGMTTHNACPEQFTFPARHMYATETLLVRQQIAELDMVANTFMRAPGESVGTFALESALDELACALDADPVAMRLRMEPTREPATGRPYSMHGLAEALRRGAARFGWAGRPKAPRARREGEWLIGTGVAGATYPYMRMPGTRARIRLDAGGAVVQVGAHEMGMGTATVQAQAAADLLGLPVERVRVEYGDSRQPAGPIAGGSSQSASIIAAVMAACEVLFGKLQAAAGPGSPLAAAAPGQLRGRDGGLCRRDAPEQCESYGSLLRRAGLDRIEAEAAAPAPEEMERLAMHSYGAQFCELRVSTVTGEVRVNRWLGSFDTGRILNPKTAASQFRGGIIMGMGLALTECTLFDERYGRIMNASLAEYHVPVHLDVPEIDVIWNDIPDPHSPLGVHGIGEIGITGAAAAVANAVYHATGIRVRELPITPDRLLAAGL